jgi:hypothetical protein
MGDFAGVKKALLVLEKVIIRVGAILGILATVALLRSEVLKPGPPNIDISFLLSNSDEINYAQQVSDPTEKYTEPFPLGLTVYNKGKSAAKGVVLSIISDPTQTFKFNALNVETRNILKEDSFRQLFRIQLGHINPGEKVFLDENIWCQVFNIYRVKVKAVFEDEKKDVPLGELSVVNDFEIRLSAENAEMKTKYLYLTSGIEEQFKKKKKPYYIFKEGHITFIKGGA